MPKAAAFLEKAPPEWLLPLIGDVTVASLAAAMVAESLGIWPHGAEEAASMIRFDEALDEGS